MAISEQEVIYTVKANTGEVEKSIKSVKKTVEDTGDATGALTGQLDKMTGGAVSGFMAMRTGVLNTVKGMKSLRLAIAATGIGALVVAVGSLATAFTSSQEGSEKLRRVLGVLGSVMDNLLDLVADFGEGIIYAFENPIETLKGFGQAIVDNILNRLIGVVEIIPAFAEAINQALSGDFRNAAKIATDAVAKVTLGIDDYTDKAAAAIQASKDFVTQVIDEGKQADIIAKKRNRALVLERELVTERAELESQIAALRLKSRQEEEFNAEQRGEALRQAQALEDQLLDKELEVLTLRRDAQVEENKLARSSEANLNKEAEAIAAVSRLSAARLNQQRQTQRELNRINKEIERERKAEQAEQEAAAKEEAKRQQELVAARQKLEDELYAMGLSAREREELALMQAYDTRIAVAGDDEGLIAAATETFLQEQNALNQKYAIQQSAIDQQVFTQKVQMVKDSFAAIQALTTAFASTDEKNAERQFKIQKALSLASATVSSTEGVINAYKTAQGSPYTLLNPAYPAIQAGLAAAFGVAQIATIARSKYQSPAQPSAEGAAGGGTGGALQAPTLDLGFLGAGAGQDTPVRAYVLAENVSNAQQANQKIKDQTLIG